MERTVWWVGRIIAAWGLVSTLAVPAAWAQNTDAVDALMALGMDAPTAEAVLDLGIDDGIGDTFRYAVPGSVPATITDGYVDIVRRGGFAIQGMRPRTDGSVPCGSTTDAGTWVCAGTPNPGADHWLLWMELAGPVPDDGGDLTWSYSFPYYDESAGDAPWVAQGPFAWDIFQGTNRWPQLTREPGRDWRLQVTNTSFRPLISTSFALISGNMLILALPAGESGTPFELVSGAGGAALGAAMVGAAQGDVGPVISDALIVLMYWAAGIHVHDGTFGRDPSDTSGADAAPDVNSPRGPGDLDTTGSALVLITDGDPPPHTVAPSEPPPATGPAVTVPPDTAPAPTPPPSDPGSGGIPWLPIVIILIVVVAVFETQRRTRTRRSGGTPTGGDGDEPGDVSGEGFASAPDEAPSRVDFGVYVDGPAGRQVVKAPATGARHLGDYVITVTSRLDHGTATHPEHRESRKTQSQRVYAYGTRAMGYDPATDTTQDTWLDVWRMHTATSDAIISGANLTTKLLADVTDREGLRQDWSSSKYATPAVRKPSKTTTVATAGVVEKTIVGIAFEPTGRVGSHDYMPTAQSSLHVQVKADCYMHQTGATEHLSNLYPFVKVVGAGLAATCATVPKARVDGEVGVECDGTGLNYRVQQGKPLELVEGTGGSLVSFGGPEIELGLGPVKLGKASISLQPGANHILNRHLWLEELATDNHLRDVLRLDATITTDLTATSSLETDHGFEMINRIDNGLQVESTANHELVVIAAGTVDGHAVGVTLSLGAPARTVLGGDLSRLRPRLAPKANPGRSDGYIEPLGGQQRGLKHPGFAIKTGSGGSGPGKIGEKKHWGLV